MGSRRPCRECGKLMVLRITRDLQRKWFCCRTCAGRFYGRRKDMRPLLARSCTPEANVKKSQPGSANGRWRPVGSRRRTSHGYVEVKIAEPNVWQYEHRVVAKAAIGLVVHHRDEDKTNNDDANLELMTALAHLKLHNDKRRLGHDTAAQ